MKRIVVEVVPEETRMALIEDDRLIAAHAERPAHQHLVGNIYKCRVQNVLKGIEAAFVDIGAKKNAFLYIGDGKDKVKGETIHIGQSFPVQVTKDAWGTKGPSVTRTFSLPGRNVVLMPNAERIAISHRIADRDERYRLLSLAKKLRPEGMGIIVRTAAEGESEKALKDDVAYLKHLWEMLMARSRLLAAPSLLYRDADLIIRTIRDYMTDDVDELIVDDRDAYHRMIDLISYLSPELKERVKLYDGAVPLFHAYGIDDEMKTLRNRKVMLPSGGFLVIDRTEALTVIDVNTGSFVGRDNLADTVYKANLEAADEVIRQIRLRDIGGIIIVDFIDMDTDEQKEG
ncbi:MAG: Rne/Rng family ribonuclease, partial [Selenomonadaceae bacterium]